MAGTREFFEKQKTMDTIPILVTMPEEEKPQDTMGIFGTFKTEGDIGAAQVPVEVGYPAPTQPATRHSTAGHQRPGPGGLFGLLRQFLRTGAEQFITLGSVWLFWHANKNSLVCTDYWCSFALKVGKYAGQLQTEFVHIHIRCIKVDFTLHSKGQGSRRNTRSQYRNNLHTMRSGPTQRYPGFKVRPLRVKKRRRNDQQRVATLGHGTINCINYIFTRLYIPFRQKDLEALRF